MPLKETAKSLRLYFGVIAALSFYYALKGLRQDETSRLVVAMCIVNVAFGVLFGYIAVRFSYLLQSKPGFLKTVIWANLLFAVLGFVIAIFGGLQPAHFVGLLLAVLISVYLIRSVTRLSGVTAAATA
jgi:hypothetical protein